MFRKCASIMVCLVLISGCAHNINIHNAAKHAEAGDSAILRDDWDTARREYAQAAVNADLGRAPARARSVMYYEYARACGVTCHYELAEEYLHKSLKLDEESSGPIHFPLIELARLYLDQGKYDQAVPYFERALPVVENLGAATIDPIGFAEFLEEYAIALDMSGRPTDSSILKDRSADIRGLHPSAKSNTDRTPYGKHCTK